MCLLGDTYLYYTYMYICLMGDTYITFYMYMFDMIYLYLNKKIVSMVTKYHNHKLQTNTYPQFQGKLFNKYNHHDYKMKTRHWRRYCAVNAIRPLAVYGLPPPGGIL